MTSVGTAAPVACLCWQRGGVDPAAYSVVFGTVLTLAGLLFWWAPRLGLHISLPWPVTVVVLLPVLQLAPLGAARTLLWGSWRQDLDHVFARFGVEAASSISMYPLATLRGAVVLAGCCALFVMVRAMARRRAEAVIGVVASLLAVAAAEGVLGLGQSLGEVPLPGAATSGPSTAHGTFVNRNHLAVLLEAGFCLGIGLAAFMHSRGRSYLPGRNPQRFATLASQLTAALCLAGVAASGSRMGIVVASVAALAGAFVLARPAKRRLFLLPIGLLTLFLVTALSFPDRAPGFVKLLRDGGDPGRIAIWSDALTTAARHLPIGSGLGTFAFAFRRSEPYFPRNTIDHAHCDWLEFLVELGLPGTLFLAGSIGLAFACGCRRAQRHAPDPLASLRVACLLAAGAILLHSSVDFPLQVPALAALFSVLLGCAAGLRNHGSPFGGAGPVARWSVALGCWSFAFVAAAVHWGEPRSSDAGYLYERGQRQLFVGQAGEADQSFRKSLEANPYSALVWQKRAEAARLGGNPDREIELLELASRLEPFTLRTEWRAAQSLLRQQRWEQASRRLRGLAEDLPDLRPAIFRAALQAGMPAAWIATSVVAENAAGPWLRVLADREAWDHFDQTLLQWAGSREVAASPEDLRYVFDRLFQRRRQRLMLDLWKALGGKGLAEPFGLRSLPVLGRNRARDPSSRIELVAPDVSPVDRDRAGALGYLPVRDRFAFGFGFQWVSQPTPGVLLHTHETSVAGPRIELDFRAPPKRESVYLSHYFAATPGAAVVLEAPVMAENWAGGEVRLEIWSARRLLGSSPPIRRSAPWQGVNISFQAEAGEEVLQLRLVSAPAPGREMRGRFFLGAIRMRSAHDTARGGSPRSLGHAGV